MIARPLLNELSKWERALLFAIFQGGPVKEVSDLMYIRRPILVFKLQNVYNSLPKEGFNRYRILIESIVKKLKLEK